MISDFLGEDDFKKGLNIYLQRFKYSNAVTQDLWKALSEGSGKDVNGVMNNWVKEMGYPVVSVEETEEKGKFKVSQQRFFQSGLPTPDEDTTIWTIKMAVVSESNPEIRYVNVTEKSQTISVDVASADEWVKFNAGQSGLYRVKYSPVLAKRLGNATAKLTAADKLGLVEDVFALAFAGHVPLSQGLELISNFQDETDYTVWSNLATNLGTFCDLLDGTESAPLLSKFVLKLTSKIRSLGWDTVPGEKDLNKLLRTIILGLVGGHGDEATIQEAQKRFGGFIKDHNSLSADLAGVVLRHTARNGNEETFKQLVDNYEKLAQANDVGPELRVKSLYSIGLVKSPELILKALEYAVTSPHVRSQDLMYSFAACTSTSTGREVTWNFVQQHWDNLKKKLGGGSFLFGRIIKCMSGFSSEAKAAEVEAFFESRKDPSTERTTAQTLEAIRANTAALKFHNESTHEWLKQYFAQ